MTALKSIAFKEPLERSSIIEKDNDLYQLSYSDGEFSVNLLVSDTTIRCNLEPKMYSLAITATELHLKSLENFSVIAKWPYRYIRKYGYRHGKFTFEAGRKCETGEGVFRFDHYNPQEIFNCMSARMKSMKEMIHGEGSVDCSENQLSAALTMEAGSRTPLPPYQHNNSTEFDLSSHFSVPGFISSNDSLNNVSTSSTSFLLKKLSSIPDKPPRKTLGQTNLNNNIVSNDKSEHHPSKGSEKYLKFQNYEPVSISGSLVCVNNSSDSKILRSPSPHSSKDINKNLTLVIPQIQQIDKSPELPIRNPQPIVPDRDYECIEPITDAWKTRGINNIRHTEHITTPEDELKEFIWMRSKSQRSKGDELKINKEITIEDDDYDKLEYFGSNNKINSSYKSIVLVPPALKKQTSQPVTTNEYELIDNPDIQPCRLADDRYAGYGAVRSVPGPQIASKITTTVLEDDSIDHYQRNGLDYTVVSKAKRV